MTINELNAKTTKELNDLLVAFSQELMNLRFRKQLMEVKDTSQFSKIRKKIARVKMILKQR
jgi:large subunit ribosomal protein L29